MKLNIAKYLKEAFSMFSDTEKQISELKIKLSQWVLEDGSVINVDDETKVVSKVNEEDGTLSPLPEGTYKLIDGSEIVVDAESKLVPQVDETPVDEVVVEEDMGKRAVNEATEQTEEVVEEDKKDEEKYAKQFDIFAKTNIELQNQLKEQIEKFEKLNKEFEDFKKTSVEKLNKRVVKTFSEEKKNKTWAEMLNEKRK